MKPSERARAIVTRWGGGPPRSQHAKMRVAELTAEFEEAISDLRSQLDEAGAREVELREALNAIRIKSANTVIGDPEETIELTNILNIAVSALKTPPSPNARRIEALEKVAKTAMRVNCEEGSALDKALAELEQAGGVGR